MFSRGCDHHHFMDPSLPFVCYPQKFHSYLPSSNKMAFPPKRRKTCPLPDVPREIWWVICSKIVDPVDWNSWQRTCKLFAATPVVYDHPFVIRSRHKNALWQTCFFHYDTMFKTNRVIRAVVQMDGLWMAYQDMLYCNSRTGGLLELAIRKGMRDSIIIQMIRHPNTQVSRRNYAVVVLAILCGRLQLARLMLWQCHLPETARMRFATQRTLRGVVSHYNQTKLVDRITRQVIISAFRNLRTNAWKLDDVTAEFGPQYDKRTQWCNHFNEVYCFLGFADPGLQLDGSMFTNHVVREATEFYMRRQFWETETSAAEYELLIMKYC